MNCKREKKIKIDYLQSQTMRILNRIIDKYFDIQERRIIKIHGSSMQEAGLPDVIILLKAKDFNKSKNTPESFQLWIEIKRNWKDTPTELQMNNIKKLPKFGFITGYIVGGEFKYSWDDENTHEFESIIERIYRMSLNGN